MGMAGRTLSMVNKWVLVSLSGPWAVGLVLLKDFLHR